MTKAKVISKQLFVIKLVMTAFFSKAKLHLLSPITKGYQNIEIHFVTIL